MDTLFFFKERVSFIRDFYKDAASVFESRITKIVGGEKPYDLPRDAGNEYEEPPFQDEWTNAKESLEVLGLTCVSMLSASIQVYFLEWEAATGMKWRPKERGKLFGKHGVAGYVHEIVDLFNPPSGKCPADLGLIEQVILARNATQHPERITDLIPQHRRGDLKKYRHPFFLGEFEATFLEGDIAQPSIFVPRIRVSREKLMQVLDEAETLAMWMDEILQWARTRRLHRSCSKPPCR